MFSTFGLLAQNYGNFYATIKNNPQNLTNTQLSSGCQLNLILDIPNSAFPNYFVLDNGLAGHYVDIIMDFSLRDLSGSNPDVFLEKKYMHITGANRGNSLEVDANPGVDYQHWNLDRPFELTLSLDAATQNLVNTQYKLMAIVQRVIQTNDANSSSLFSSFDINAVNLTSGLKESCSRTQNEVILSNGFFDNLNCTLDHIFDFEYVNAGNLLAVTTSSIFNCTTNNFSLTANATGGTQPYSYSWNNSATQATTTYPTGAAYAVTVTDAIGCKRSTSGTLGTPITNAFFDYPNGLYITNASQTVSDLNGDQVIRVKGPIVIEEGVKLNWSNKKIQFTRDDQPAQVTDRLPHSGVVVKAFAKLTLNNCELTGVDYCSAMWEGIQVRGSEVPDLQVNESGTQWFQGELLLNNCEIRDAVIGVALYNRNREVSVPFGGAALLRHGNGKITATTSRFINNRVGIAFQADYKNESASTITNCSFTCDAPMKDLATYQGEGTDKFISIVGIDELSKKIEIKANTFTGNGAFAPEKRGTAIYSNGSACIISSGKVGTNLVPNTFANLTKGVDVYSTGSLTHVTRIKDNRFNNVMQGVTSNGSNFDEISFNTFNIPAGTSTVNTWGLNLYNSSGFLASENSFSTLASSPFTYGVLARNNSLANGRLYRNTFSGDFFAATQAEQNNSKLEIKCNTYTGDNAYDWAVTSGLLADQGECQGTNTTTPSGNEFSGCSALDESQIFLAPLVPSFKYSAHENAVPICYTSGIDVVPCNIDKDPGSCPVQVQIPTGLGKKTGGSSKFTAVERQAEIRRLQEEGSIQDLISFVSGGQVPENVYLLIPTLIERGDCAQARLKLELLVNNSKENAAFLTLYEVLTTLCEGKRELAQLNALEHQQIKDISEGDTRVSVHAQAVLSALNEKAYLRIAEKALNQSGMQIQSTKQEEKTQILVFEVYPNPSAGDITIDFKQEKSGNLLITDAMGRIIFSKSVNNEKTQETNLSQGIYLVQFTDAMGNIERKQVFISK